MEIKPPSNSIENHPWLIEFKQKNGRMPRVLHIGNIANNAYINAKIMRRVGIEADVLCPDYYHIMGCPEWEDAEFEGDVGDPNMPDWWSVNLKGFKRPPWFLQGPNLLVLRYLSNKNNNKILNSIFLKNKINFYRWVFSSRSKQAVYISKVIKLLIVLKRKLQIFKGFIFSWRRLPKIILLKTFNGFLQSRSKLANQRRKSKNVFFDLLWLLDFPFRSIIKYKDQFFLKAKSYEEQIVSIQVTSEKIDNPDLTLPCTSILQNADLASYLVNIDLWKKALSHYDIIQGYALDGIYPLMAGIQNYTAYEHGTLRDVPFVDDAQGRICKNVYKSAGMVFVTNTDCLAAAEKLEIEKHRIVPLPHAFDSHKVFNFYHENRNKIRVKTNPVTFMAPARHHWTTGYVSWRKGNDVIIHAAKLLNQQGFDFKIIFVEWGNEVEQSKNLIAELKLEHCFEWIRPVLKKQLWIYYLEAAAVIDQFVVPAMGGVCFEALALGRPLLTRLDLPVLEKFFGVAPPVYNAATADELAKAMFKIINDQDGAAGVGQKAQEWIKNHHSSEVILNLQLSAYQRLVSD